MRGSVSTYWWLPLDSISFKGLANTLMDEEEKPYINAVAYELPHPKDANYFTVDLTVLKKMAQELADLFCLTLPVSWKK